MGQLYNITQGWKMYLGDKTTQFERDRADICKECPNAVVGTYEQLMPDFSLKEIQGLKCDICKCPLSTKIRSEDSECPLGKWFSKKD